MTNSVPDFGATADPTPNVRQIAYIIGMPRAGTTSLYHNLGRHPQIRVPFRRKTNYFCLHSEKSRSWFLGHFKELAPGQIGIDTATLHFADRERRTLQRIKELNPSAKAMLFVRSPASWAWSFYRQIATFDSRMPSFETFLSGQYAFKEDGVVVPFNMRDGDIEARIREARNCFGPNLLIVDFRLFSSDLLGLLQSIEGFLGIRPHFNAGNIGTRKLNAHDRGNIVAIQRVLRSPSLISMLGVLPRAFVSRVRFAYDFLSEGLSRGHRANTPEDLPAIAKTRFAADEAFVKRLFAQTSIFTG